MFKVSPTHKRLSLVGSFFDLEALLDNLTSATARIPLHPLPLLPREPWRGKASGWAEPPASQRVLGVLKPADTHPKVVALTKHTHSTLQVLGQ